MFKEIVENLDKIFAEREVKFSYATMDKEQRWEYWVNMGGTFGYDDAFRLACEQANKPLVYDMYSKMEWFESDMFDGFIVDVAVYYGILSEPVIDVFVVDED